MTTKLMSIFQTFVPQYITYGYANEREGLIYTRAIRLDKESETH